MIEITSSIHIDEGELQFEFIRASGPGGQNVNKVASAVQLRFDILNSASLPADVKMRLIKLGGKRVTDEGILMIEAKRHRTQEQNKADAIQRFSELARKAVEKPKPRRKTKPTKTSMEKRLKVKKQRSDVKRGRREKNFE